MCLSRVAAPSEALQLPKCRILVHVPLKCSLMFQELNKVHTGFLSDLQQACVSKTPTGIKLPECFTKWKNEFLIYGDFCSNLPRAQERIDEICRRNQTNNQYIEVNNFISRRWSLFFSFELSSFVEQGFCLY